MITERLQQLIDEMAALPPEEQDRVAAFERVMDQASPVLEYLKDK